HPETDDEQEGGRATGPAPAVAGMEVDGVDEPGRQGGRLLRVPAPVAWPGEAVRGSLDEVADAGGEGGREDAIGDDGHPDVDGQQRCVGERRNEGPDVRWEGRRVQGEGPRA